MNDISSLRKEYASAQLDMGSIEKSPLIQFEKWFQDALRADILEPNAMVLSTVDTASNPSQRTVLLKELDASGFVFFTNYSSQKAQQLDLHPYASLLFPWYTLERQVSIRGKVEKVDIETSRAYFYSRPYGSQLGAWVSRQSSSIESREILDAKLAELKSKYPVGTVPFPDFWGGYRLIPTTIEFWQGRQNRLHDRILYEAVGSNCNIKRLAP